MQTGKGKYLSDLISIMAAIKPESVPYFSLNFTNKTMRKIDEVKNMLQYCYAKAPLTSNQTKKIFELLILSVDELDRREIILRHNVREEFEERDQRE